MAEKNAPAEIRIIKKRKSHAGHHGGAWKVAYADFVTAMMAFFLVMWIVGLSGDIKAAIAGYFNDPIAFMEAVEAGRAAFEAPGVKAGTGYPGPDEKGISEEREGLAKAKTALEKIVAASPEFRDLKDFIDIKLVNEGLQVDLIDGKKNLFFDSASATIKPATRHLLTLMARELSKLPNPIIVEGHTDIRPLSRKAGYTNWELSADRANSARKVMEAGGLRKNQVDQVRGYAATHPRNKDPYHFSNRRVSIIVILNKAKPSKSVTFDGTEDLTGKAAEKESGKFEINIAPKQMKSSPNSHGH